MPGQRKFFFVHLQKTAGTSLLIRLREHFGVRAIYPTPGERSLVTSFSVDLLAKRFAARQDEIQVVSGHFPLAASEVLGAPFTVFTVLRDPVQRTLSYLRQQQAEVDQYKSAPLDEIYDDPWRRGWLLTNHMVRMLGQKVEELAAGTMAPDDENLDRAKKALTERVDLFGFQDSFDEFCVALGHRYGWDLGEPVRANTTPPSTASDGLTERIRLDNWADVELFEFARRVAGA
jgi:hypothetical protein